MAPIGSGFGILGSQLVALFGGGIGGMVALEEVTLAIPSLLVLFPAYSSIVSFRVPASVSGTCCHIPGHDGLFSAWIPSPK